MVPRLIHPLTPAALAVVVLALGACGTGSDRPGAAGPSSAASGRAAGSSGTVTVSDLHGQVDVAVPPQRVVAADNRAFRILDRWGIALTAAPVDLMPKDVSYKTDPSVANLGTHTEPKLELLVSSRPDVVLIGQRFANHYGKIKELAADAAVVDINLDPNNRIDIELKRHAALLGQIFDRPGEAAALASGLDASIAKAKNSYDPTWTVMGLLTSGGKISYAAPGTGRSVGPFFPILGLTPALQQAGKDDSHGDDVSVEAIAAANPDWLIVLDRDAAVGDGATTSAEELITKSPALANVTAVTKGNIVVLPSNFYVAEDILNYTAAFEQLAKAFEAAK